MVFPGACCRGWRRPHISTWGTVLSLPWLGDRVIVVPLPPHELLGPLWLPCRCSTYRPRFPCAGCIVPGTWCRWCTCSCVPYPSRRTLVSRTVRCSCWPCLAPQHTLGPYLGRIYHPRPSSRSTLGRACPMGLAPCSAGNGGGQGGEVLHRGRQIAARPGAPCRGRGGGRGGHLPPKTGDTPQSALPTTHGGAGRSESGPLLQPAAPLPQLRGGETARARVPPTKDGLDGLGTPPS